MLSLTSGSPSLIKTKDRIWDVHLFPIPRLTWVELLSFDGEFYTVLWCGKIYEAMPEELLL